MRETEAVMWRSGVGFSAWHGREGAAVPIRSVSSDANIVRRCGTGFAQAGYSKADRGGGSVPRAHSEGVSSGDRVRLDAKREAKVVRRHGAEDLAEGEP